MENIESIRDEQSVSAEIPWTIGSAQQSRWDAIVPLLSLVLIPAAWYAAMTLLIHALMSTVEEINFL